MWLFRPVVAKFCAEIAPGGDCMLHAIYGIPEHPWDQHVTGADVLVM